MKDLEQRVKDLETKVKILEETLETLKNMQLSEQMKDYIASKTRTLKMASLLNAVSEDNDTVFDLNQEKENIESVIAQKIKIDDQIQSSVKYRGSFSDDMPDDPRYFEYEIEDGISTKPSYLKSNITPEKPIIGLEKYVGKGLRITAYNGFGSNRVIVPKEIDGIPVISIGVEAFKNATFFEVVLPSSLKAIMMDAFKGCKNLSHIDLPTGLTILGDHCFSDSAIQEINFPDTIERITWGCCSGCKNLKRVEFGKNTISIENYAFAGCVNLEKVKLPKNLKEIQGGAFASTALQALIVPENVVAVSPKLFVDLIDDQNYKRDLVFMGKNTVLGNIDSTKGKSLQVTTQMLETFAIIKTVKTIYCLPGSSVQQYARINDIAMKPLGEFGLEDYQ